MSAEQLAEAVSALGLRYTRTQVTNLESGRRDSITVGEIFSFAEVLDVPAVALLFPVGQVAEVEVLPGVVRDTWDALRWFTAEPPQTFALGKRDPWLAATEPLRQYRKHQDLMLQLQRHERRRVEAFATTVRPADQEPPTPERLDTAEQVMRAEEAAVADLEDQLIELRREMRQRGYLLPLLPDGRKYLDQEAEVSE